jgi:hypothetical protein
MPPYLPRSHQVCSCHKIVWQIVVAYLFVLFVPACSVVNSVVFHKDGGCIASGSADNTIKLWDIRTHQLIQHYPAHSDAVTSVSIHPVCSFLLFSKFVGLLPDCPAWYGSLTVRLLPALDLSRLVPEAVGSARGPPDLHSAGPQRLREHVRLQRRRQLLRERRRGPAGDGVGHQHWWTRRSPQRSEGRLGHSDAHETALCSSCRVSYRTDCVV